MKLTQILRGGAHGLKQVRPDYQYFGHLEDKVRGIVIYRLSPYEVKAFGPYSLNDLIIRRICKGFASWAPYSIVAYLIYKGVEDAYHKSLRKNPSDYPQSKEDYEEMVNTNKLTIKKDAHQQWQTKATELKAKTKTK